jgi:Zn-dependent peptidase ImmA (M78 family)
MDLEHIASIYDIDVRTYTGPNFAEWHEEEYRFIFLNAYLRPEQKREAFFHELCHPLKHVGRQDSGVLPPAFVELQEMQAGVFQLYAAMPYYMLEEFKNDYYSQTSLEKGLAEEFCIPESLVRKRLIQIQNRIYQGHFDQLRNEPPSKVRITPEHVKKVMEDFGRKRREKEENERILRNA